MFMKCKVEQVLGFFVYRKGCEDRDEVSCPWLFVLISVTESEDDYVLLGYLREPNEVSM